MTDLALPPLVLRGVVFAPPLFSAPMAGVTHSAFRRLLSDFGGYGALCSEMLSGKYLSIQNAPDFATARTQAQAFFASSPRLSAVDLAGL